MITNFQNHIEDRFNRFIIQAICIHFLLIILAIVFQKVLGLEFLNQDRDKKINIIQSSVRVDVVSMPKFTVQELKVMKVAEPPAEVVKKEEVEAPKAVDKTPEDLTFKEKGKNKIDLKNLLNNIGNKPKAKGQVDKKKNQDVLEKHQKQLRSLILEGNKVSSGTSLVGDSLKQDNSLFAEYVSSLPNFVRPYWKLPSYLLEQELNCRIKIFIAANGKILRAEIYESSGVREFDQKALAAIQKVTNLPKPTREILSRVTAGEVVLGFPL